MYLVDGLPGPNRHSECGSSTFQFHREFLNGHPVAADRIWMAEFESVATPRDNCALGDPDPPFRLDGRDFASRLGADGMVIQRSRDGQFDRSQTFKAQEEKQVP